ncbi:PREDICTED: histone H1-like isoform X1 [Nelumbo nucifera]|uniref:Histone H1-like isoform X1 n=1 Tax=Nelumbo nucifera TaxID=4432 RepID=A0A1U7ZXZ2_NELNU|nr:PREDICTED: histone H1-like isoform X1 [Nelumbo nucifera]
MAKEASAVPAVTKKSKSKSSKLPSPLHPPYFQMITEAISSLKDRTGSSQYAIAKFIEDKYKTELSPNFKKVLSVQLKKFLKSERLVKVKNSFKISPIEKAKCFAFEIKQKQKKSNAEGKSGTEKTVKKNKGVETAKMRVSKKLSSTPTGKSKTLMPKGKNSAKLVKTKGLSQVKTPDGRKKKVSTPKKKASISVSSCLGLGVYYRFVYVNVSCLLHQQINGIVNKNDN